MLRQPYLQETQATKQSPPWSHYMQDFMPNRTLFPFLLSLPLLLGVDYLAAQLPGNKCCAGTGLGAS